LEALSSDLQRQIALEKRYLNFRCQYAEATKGESLELLEHPTDTNVNRVIITVITKVHVI
jgi:hypothetical protein